ncbi:MAG: DUF4037 domain-containing protein [Lachnospiraceae bacterium]|nr:DUF4037 domain-containing protein [Lachnospiraceae bacterium]
MNGADISRAYFEQYGKPMLEEQFPQLLPFLAAGLAGSGSECFGFDDEVSRDHDFEPGFCLFLPGEEVVDRRSAFLLERAYAALPKEFMGLKRSLMQPVGGSRRGVLRTAEFFMEKTGTPDGNLTLQQWLSVPEQSLAEAVNGSLYFDSLQEVTGIREKLARYPDDVRRKKLAGSLLLMAQSGQYNYLRCLSHGEEAAAQLAVGEFVRSTMSVIFLLNNRYQPYYKWSFRALRALPKLSIEAELMEFLLTTDNSADMAQEKYDVMEGMAADIIDELLEQQLTGANCGDLEKHAYSVNDGIADGDLRNMHILSGV